MTGFAPDWLFLLIAAAPAGALCAWLRASYAGRDAPSRLEIVVLIFACGLAAIWAGATPGLSLVESCALGWLLIALAAIDLDCRRLPNPLTLSLIATGLLATWLRQPDLLGAHLLATAIGWGGFYAVAELYFRLRGREGLGLGDAKLLGGLGAWVGPFGLPSVVLIGALGALASLAVRSRLSRLTRPSPSARIWRSAAGWFGFTVRWS